MDDWSLPEPRLAALLDHFAAIEAKHRQNSAVMMAAPAWEFDDPKRRAAPLGNGPSIVAPRKLAGALEFLPSERSLRAKFLRGGNNPGLFDHAGRKTMRHWITSFRLVDDAGMLR